jgi:hypothetical protein
MKEQDSCIDAEEKYQDMSRIFRRDVEDMWR